MLLMATLVYFLTKANVDGTMKFKNAIGVSGELYRTIPAGRGNVGMVQVKKRDHFEPLKPLPMTKSDIPTGKIITVMKVLNNNLLVVTAE